METQDLTKATFLTVSKFQSIKTKILIFALLATILPALILGWLSYLQSSKLLREKISNELNNATVQASGKLDLWLKDRLYDLRVFSSSYLISETLSGMLDDAPGDLKAVAARGQIKAYLTSVGEKYKLYKNLILINRDGVPIVNGSYKSSAMPLPEKWLEQLQRNLMVEGKAQFPAFVDQESMYIAESVRASDGSTLGVLAARVNLNAVRAILKLQTTGGIDEVYLVDDAGQLLVSSNAFVSEPPYTLPRRSEYLSKTKNHHRTPTEYVSHHDRAVVGTAVPLSFMEWTMVAEMEKENAYAEIIMLRRITILLVSGLMLCMGILAYIFGRRLVHPVRRLSSEAARVASGNLDADIPVVGLSEVSYLTQVFNHMVASLRLNREELSSANHALRATNEELQQISITDGLTGLYNRKHIMDLLGREMSRSQRSHRSLSVLMLDIDHFKTVNDTYGHQVGDAVIGRLANAIRESVRECDHVGRYGGEEFVILLPDSTVEDAAVTAERIRKNVSHIQFTEGDEEFSVTTSIGVAGYPVHGENTESILGHADNALYQAKADGRDRVVTSEKEDRPGMATVHVLPSRDRRSSGRSGH